MTAGFEQMRQAAEEQWDRLSASDTPVITVGTATCGRSAGALDTLDVLRGELAGRDLECCFVEVGCLGPCYAEPLVTVSLPGAATVLFGSVDIKGARKIAAYVAGGELPEKLALATTGPDSIPGIPDLMDTPMMKGQVRRVLRNCGVIDPGDIQHSVARGAYSGLQRARELDRDARIGELDRSGLRGRGGAGFPVSRKWNFCIDAPGDTRYIICNADEGDPGAFMNRSLLEGDPHAVLEGMIIAGLTIGAAEGFIYCRAEYPLALERLAVAIEQAEQAGFLGGSRPTLPDQGQGGCGCVRLRRGDRADRLPGGAPRHASCPPALPRGQRAVGLPHRHQQRGDPRVGRTHLPARRRLVC